MQHLKKNQELIKELMEQRISTQNDYPVLPDEELKRKRIKRHKCYFKGGEALKT